MLKKEKRKSLCTEKSMALKSKFKNDRYESFGNGSVRNKDKKKLKNKSTRWDGFAGNQAWPTRSTRQDNDPHSLDQDHNASHRVLSTHIIFYFILFYLLFSQTKSHVYTWIHRLHTLFEWPKLFLSWLTQRYTLKAPSQILILLMRHMERTWSWDYPRHLDETSC